MTTNRLFLDIHVIQTVPPSNINRDDTGSPKTALYGGVRRARVSSQSWKKAIRDYFKDNSAEENVGVRSLDVVQYIADKINAIDGSKTSEDALKLAEEFINEAGVKTKDSKVRALFFIGETQAQRIAEAAIEGRKDKKALQEILKDNPAVDIALFGRMVADDPSLNEDASCQVAHAISTHAVQTEFDFFTAVDDLAAEDNAGAGMLGTIEYNSSTLYRYANVAVHELSSQLGDKEATINALKLFIESFSNSLPTGKINTFANQNLPQLLMINIRTDRPVNLVSAFEEPIKSNHGFSEQSIDKLLHELEKSQKFVKEPEASVFISTHDIKDSTFTNCEVENLIELQEKVTNVLDQLLSGV